jgi:bleomycin hydrolase
MLTTRTRAAALIIFVMALSIFVTGAIAGEKGELDKGLIEQLQKSFDPNGRDRAMINAVSNNDLNDLSLDREIINEHDNIYTFKVDAKGITNQESTGRCWLFAGLNVMRPAVMKKYNIAEFEFSENHLFFWDKLEKANMFLETIIETSDRDIDDRELQAILKDPVPDGGWWNYVVALIDKYGAVPKPVSTETKHSSATRRLNGILGGMMRHDAAKLREMAAGGASVEDLRAVKKDMLTGVYRILALHFGVPPEKFVWRVRNKDDELIEQEFTPKSFYKDAVGVDLKEYVTVMDHPAYEYGKFYRLNFCRNFFDEEDMGFINLGAEGMKELAERAVLDGDPVWFAADIGKENYGEEGILKVGIYDYDALFGVDLELTKKQMVTYGHSTPNHAMVFVGIDRKDDKPVKWLVENSWGTKNGDKGYWAMYTDWFDRYVYTVIVHKRHVPKNTLKLLDTEPVRIPAWDPMRSAFDG